MTGTDFVLYSRQEYFRELVRAANASGKGDRLVLQTMVFDPQVPEAAAIIQAFTKAASRGADVTFVADGYSFLLSEHDKPGPLLLKGRIGDDPAKLAEPFRTTYSLLEALRQAGGRAFIINQPRRAFTLPFAGRSHVKLALVNDHVFIGGCNLDDASDIDIMASWRDSAAACRLQRFVDEVTTAGSVWQALGGNDLTIDLHGGQLFIDAGIRRQSVILRQAYQLIDEARETLMVTCQYFPGGATAQRLLAAHERGVKVVIYYSPPRMHGHQSAGHWLYNLRERLRLPALFFEHQLGAGVPRLHAKVIATESAVMLGSHNYVQAGVNLGTAEIALLRHDPALSKAVADKVSAQVAGAQRPVVT